MKLEDYGPRVIYKCNCCDAIFEEDPNTESMEEGDSIEDELKYFLQFMVHSAPLVVHMCTPVKCGAARIIGVCVKNGAH